jgi:hypothetical protein
LEAERCQRQLGPKEVTGWICTLTPLSVGLVVVGYASWLSRRA